MLIKVQTPTQLPYLKTVFITYINKLLNGNKRSSSMVAFILCGFFLKNHDLVRPSINHATKALLSKCDPSSSFLAHVEETGLISCAVL